MAHYPASRYSTGVSMSLNDIYLSLRKLQSKLKLPQKNLLAVSAAEIRRRTRLFLLQVCERIQLMRRSDVNFSTAELIALQQYWRFLKGILMQYGFITADSAFPSSEPDCHNLDTSHSRFHFHLEMIVIAVIGGMELRQTCPHEAATFAQDYIYQEDTSVVSDLAGNACSFALYNLIGLAANRFSHISSFNWLHFLSWKPYPCICCAEVLWFLHSVSSIGSRNARFSLVDCIRKTVDHLNAPLSTETVKYSRSDILVANSRPSVADPSGFILWLLFHVLPCYSNGLSSLDSKSDEKTLSSKILQPVLAELDHAWNESKARFILIFVHRSQIAGGLQLPSILLLVDFFFKHINRNFALDPVSIDSLQTLYEDGVDWSAKLASLDAIDNMADTSHLARTESSFELFLRALVTSLSRSSGETWKALKGRVLSKLHAKFFETLSMSGWSHIFDLLLVLVGKTNDETDFVSFLGDLVTETTWMDKTQIAKSMVIWRGFIALIAMYQRRNMDASALVRNFAVEFDHLARKIKTSKHDTGSISTLWPLALVYFDTTEILFTEHAECLPVVAASITPSIADLLTAGLDENKQQKLYAVISRVFENYERHFPDWRNVPLTDQARYHQAFLDALFSNVLPPLKKISTNKVATEWGCVAKCAVHLSIFSALFGQTTEENSVNGLFEFFGLQDEVVSQVAAEYLAQSLRMPEIMANLKRDDLTEGRIVHSWIRCVVELGEHQEDVQKLSLLVAEFDELKALYLDRERFSFRSFITVCGSSFAQATHDVKMVVQRRCQLYFADLNKFTSRVIRSGMGRERIESTVQMVGWLFNDCSNCLYVRGKINNVLRQLVDGILLGGEQPLVLQSLQHNLPFYFSGLCKLDYEQDNQVKDMLAAVIRTYLLKLAVVPMDQHPLRVAIQTAAEINLRIYDFSISMICQTFLTNHALPHQTAVAVSFLLRLVSQLPENAKADSAKTLFVHSVEVYLKGHDRLKDDSNLLLRKSLAACSQCASKDLRNYLALSLREKLVAGASAHPASFFGVLDVVTQYYPDLLYDILPFLTQMFGQRSPRYPAFQTAKARQAYIDILKRLGVQGQKEIEMMPK